ncbi:hypothetical protein MKW98_020359 [Papaver atlanticum]|uniref:Uncharacterized protein n=1 Tax=Papaver atlanticum TaxID=357466 RepID=A0AAD4X3C8_9MAGN|nr:hypothetical protein MKW98_020359 [Papaver atlanticum]
MLNVEISKYEDIKISISCIMGGNWLLCYFSPSQSTKNLKSLILNYQIGILDFEFLFRGRRSYNTDFLLPLTQNRRACNDIWIDCHFSMPP